MVNPGKVEGMLRNRLVHLYWDVDDEQIYTYLRENLDDFVTFSQYILEFLEQQP